MDFVAERLGHANFADLQEIDLPHCDLRTIDVGNGEVFRNLRRLVEFLQNYKKIIVSDVICVLKTFTAIKTFVHLLKVFCILRF